MTELVYEYKDTRLRFVLNPWDQKAFQRECYELTVMLGKSVPSPSAIREYMVNARIDTVTCRLSASETVLRPFLRSLGFFHAELQLRCRLALTEKLSLPRIKATLKLAEPEDREALQNIARTSFLATRFVDISNVTEQMIGSRFAAWVAQLQDENPELAYVLKLENKLIGFLFSQPTDNQGELYAAIGGVSVDAPGPYGYLLYPAVMSAYRDAGYRQVVSWIAADNIGALNLWAGIGTKFPEAVNFYLLNVLK